VEETLDGVGRWFSGITAITQDAYEFTIVDEGANGRRGRLLHDIWPGRVCGRCVREEGRRRGQQAGERDKRSEGKRWKNKVL
jgi:hypothetical protein